MIRRSFLKLVGLAAGVSRRNLAAKLDIHDATLWRWEKGTTTINKHLLKAWDVALKNMVGKVHPTSAAGAESIPPNALAVTSACSPSAPPDQASRDPQPVAGGTPEPDKIVCEHGFLRENCFEIHKDTHQTCADWRCSVCNPQEECFDCHHLKVDCRCSHGEG